MPSLSRGQQNSYQLTGDYDGIRAANGGNASRLIAHVIDFYSIFQGYLDNNNGSFVIVIELLLLIIIITLS